MNETSKENQKAASGPAKQRIKRRTKKQCKEKTVSMQHPAQANYLSTSFVAEVERAKTQEGVKSTENIKTVPQANRTSKDRKGNK